MRKQIGKHVSLTTIQRLIRQTKLNNDILVITGKIEFYRIDACTQFKVVHKRIKDLNGTHLIILDQAHAKTNGTTEASEKNTLITHSYLKRYGQSNSSSETKTFSTSDKALSYDGSREAIMYHSTGNAKGVYNRK